MFRDIFANRGIQAALVFFLLVVIGGTLYLNHVKRDAEKEVAQVIQTLPQAVSVSPIQSSPQLEYRPPHIVEETDTQAAEKPASDAMVSAERGSILIGGAELRVGTDAVDMPLETDIPEPMDFKTTPEGYPLTPYWDQSAAHQKNWSYDHKLIDHVLVKLWRQGVRNFEGGSIDDTGSVRPHYTNTLYVEWDEALMDNGTKRRYISYFLGPAGVWEKEDFFDVPPSSIRLIDANSPEGQGIYPYAFLTSQELP